ncbi:hypothetical protein COLO4_25283 [Corchorus olitorius]|uniref:Uncharacterized protein n=1 Tax=Corchorus olitorius TaxID=93759 RepID=A0A1R3I3S5_9ROSI|nr:hypothetical protein COLO4_25283 [Corchorus olitorius]
METILSLLNSSQVLLEKKKLSSMNDDGLHQL